MERTGTHLKPSASHEPNLTLEMPALLKLRRTLKKVRLLSIALYRMVKRVRRAVGGASQVERICADDSTSAAEMTLRFWHEWSASRRLRTLFETRAHAADLDIASTAADIASLKSLSADSGVRANLARCLTHIAARNQAVAHIRVLQTTRFNPDNSAHADQLNALWRALLSGEPPEGRVTRAWGAVGFQQADPATDFRGGGELSLKQLVHFATERRSMARRMIREPAEEAARYPWACVGINITNEAVKLLDDRVLDRALFGLPVPRAVEAFHSIYSDMFEILHSMWLKAEPENILDFPPVMKAAMLHVREELERTGTLVPPGL